jgi:hypothetical protein
VQGLGWVGQLPCPVLQGERSSGETGVVSVLDAVSTLL